MQIYLLNMNLFVFTFMLHGFIVSLFSAKTQEKQDVFPSNWRDYIDPIMLKNIPVENLKSGLNNVIANKDKRWTGKKTAGL